MTNQNWNLVGVPIDCDGRLGGNQLLPKVMREQGLVERLQAEDLGDMHVRLDDPRREAQTGIVGFEQVCQISKTIREDVRAMLEAGKRPFVVGGCCTLLIGVMAALKDLYGEKVGLAFIDGHLDFYDGKSSPSGEPADMELAIITGTGPKELTELCGPAPIVKAENVAVIGFRDEMRAARDGAPDPRVVAPELLLVDDRAIKDGNAQRYGEMIAEKFRKQGIPFWLHIDVDVLDQEIMPAVNYLQPGGLNWQELEDLLRPLAKCSGLIGVDFTILNPNLDIENRAAKKSAELLGNVFGKGD